ncbi:hypothetical protein CcCBS67573_g08005 [Chytriomyces confervae]|uniref:EF-hand domain-containing protein n=1 Tax=Chytriomyces confervae TaxID=246404 RepID=A0A507ERM2_9FUNG|nr:hypothetical protein CcCBS67573_g08005 [Chytriomyces confervae]
MATEQDLHARFEKFCAFGRGSVGSSLDSLTSGSTMDGAKWAKFARDCNLIDNKRVTSTDIDIIFNKVKAKSARRIDWEEFQVAVKLVAGKKYPKMHEQDAYTKTIYDACILSNGPVARATTVKNDPVLDRLTDVSGYTGTHKNRFDSAGRGLGLNGRVTGKSTDTLSKIVNRDAPSQQPLAQTNRQSVSNRRQESQSTMRAPTAASSISQNKRASVLTQSEEKLENIVNAPKKAPIAGRRSQAPHATTKGGNYTTSSSLASSQQSLAKSSTTASKSSVFDRLTDSSGYTGTHQHRFNADGSGRGLAGRDSAPLGKGGVIQYRGGNVNSLSQILRS